MFTVTTPAVTTALTTLDAVKTNLKITGGADDAWLQTQIDSATLTICNYLGVEQAEDGSRTLGRQTVVETLDRRSRYPWQPPFGVIVPQREADATIVLALGPVTSIESITENGTAVDPADFLLSAVTKKVKRLSSALLAAWPCTLIVVTYTAGCVLPGQAGRNLPADIEQAAINLIQANWFARGTNPNVKSENVFGVRQVDYFFGTPGQGIGALPQDVMAKLNPYRNMSL